LILTIESSRRFVKYTITKIKPDSRAPYPVVWDDRERQTLFAGFVLATAKAIGVDLRWSGDWDSDTEVRDNSFDDLVHFEIVE